MTPGMARKCMRCASAHSVAQQCNDVAATITVVPVLTVHGQGPPCHCYGDDQNHGAGSCEAWSSPAIIIAMGMTSAIRLFHSMYDQAPPSQ